MWGFDSAYGRESYEKVREVPNELIKHHLAYFTYNTAANV